MRVSRYGVALVSAVNLVKLYAMLVQNLVEEPDKLLVGVDPVLVYIVSAMSALAAEDSDLLLNIFLGLRNCLVCKDSCCVNTAVATYAKLSFIL